MSLINDVLVLGVQHGDSVTHLYVSILFQILFPFSFLQNTEQSSKSYTGGPGWLSCCLDIGYVTPPSSTVLLFSWRKIQGCSSGQLSVYFVASGRPLATLTVLQCWGWSQRWHLQLGICASGRTTQRVTGWQNSGGHCPCEPGARASPAAPSWWAGPDLRPFFQSSRLHPCNWGRGSEGVAVTFSFYESFFLIFIYLGAPDLSCGTRDLPSSSLPSCRIFSCSKWTLSYLMWYLVAWPGIEPGCPALAAWSLSFCTTRESLY